MHRKAIVIVSLCLVALPLFAASEVKNLQKIFPVNSDVYKAITCLYIDQGLSLPSTSGPWSADELTKMLDRIEPSRLKGGSSKTYSFAHKSLDEGHKTFRFGLTTTAEGYWHRNTTDFTKESQWIRGFEERNPLFDLVLETWLSRYFYGYSSLSLQESMNNRWNSIEGATSTLWGSSRPDDEHSPGETRRPERCGLQFPISGLRFGRRRRLEL